MFALQADGLSELAFLDFLAYMPLFLDIHGSIMQNPLSGK